MNTFQKNLVLTKIQEIYNIKDWDFILVELNKLLMQVQLDFDRDMSVRNENPELYDQFQDQFREWKSKK